LNFRFQRFKPHLAAASPGFAALCSLWLTTPHPGLHFCPICVHLRQSAVKMGGQQKKTFIEQNQGSGGQGFREF
jgi:hypothetical protein